MKLRRWASLLLAACAALAAPRAHALRTPIDTTPAALIEAAAAVVESPAADGPIYQLAELYPLGQADDGEHIELAVFVEAETHTRVLCIVKSPLGLWAWDNDWVQYGLGGLFGFHGLAPVGAGLKGAGVGLKNEVVGVGKLAYGATVGLGEQITLTGMDTYRAYAGKGDFESAIFSSVYSMELEGKSTGQMWGEAGLTLSGYRFGNQIFESSVHGFETGDFEQFSENMGQLSGTMALSAAGVKQARAHAAKMVIRKRVLANIAESQKARSSSNFGVYAAKDRLIAGAPASSTATAVSTVSRVVPRQTTLIGSGRDTRGVASDWPGHNVLDVPDWSAKLNIKWLDSAIRRGDDIFLATDPVKHSALMQELGLWSAFTDLELLYLRFKGYVQDGVYMVPKK